MKFTPGIMAVSKALALVQVNLIGLTPIGDMFGFNAVPLSAVFDGVTNQASAACPQKQTTNANSAYVGITLTSAKRIGQVKVYGTNNSGFFATDPVVTLRVYGKLGSDPANSTDGTLLASDSFTDTNNQSAGKTYTITDTNTYDRVWVYMQQNTATLRVNSVAEIEIWELV